MGTDLLKFYIYNIHLTYAYSTVTDLARFLG